MSEYSFPLTVSELATNHRRIVVRLDPCGPDARAQQTSLKRPSVQTSNAE